MDNPSFEQFELDNQNPLPANEKKTKPKDQKKTNVDPVTGKPIPSKKVLSHLTQATAQLAQMRLKKLREDLDKQRLKVAAQKPGDQPQAGPALPEKPVEKDDAIQKTLKASKSTGEFKGLIGG